MKYFLSLIVVVLLCDFARGQGDTRVDAFDSVDLYFRFDKDLLELDYMSNRSSLSKLSEILNVENITSVDSIIVKATSSPDGSFWRNERLARQRARAIRGYIVWKYPYVDQSIIRMCTASKNWHDLYSLLGQDKNIPHREKAINIINSSINESTKEWRLRQLSSGESWNYIERHYLRYLRKGATCVFYYKESVGRDADNAEAERDVRLDVDEEICCSDDNAAAMEFLDDGSLKFDAAESKIPELAKVWRPIFAIKTNLLADVLTAVNLELEVPIANRWSIGLECLFPWWTFDGGKYYNQILMTTLEGKYWFRTNRHPQLALSGHSVGVYASVGYYDVQWLKKGFQGEVLPSCGVSYSYAHAIGKKFRMEYSIGFGATYTNYREYTANDNYDKFPWVQSGNMLWFGPTRAEVSLMWLIGKNK